MDKYKLGYPKSCSMCSGVLGLSNIEPHYQDGNNFKLMLIGQDPTIFKKPDRVKEVLMLDADNNQLKRWLKALFGEEYDSLNIYATNLVKCSFPMPPSKANEGAYNFLKKYYSNCKNYLMQEIINFKPSLVMTFGEPAHSLFIENLEGYNQIPKKMNEAFTGKFIKIKLDNIEFDYSPCLHIKTFRVAETYGDKVKHFKKSLIRYLNQ